MKKLLILILITLLLILTMFIGIKGVTIGKIEILGIQGIQTKNSELDSKIQDAAKLVEKTYAQTISEVNSNAKKLKEAAAELPIERILLETDCPYLAPEPYRGKRNSSLYLPQVVAALAEIKGLTCHQIEKYEIETLWVKLGNHATSEGVVMKMDVTSGSSGAQDSYNLNFTVTGGYVQIEDFISSIENDSTLGFKIEEFKMAPSGNDLQATFVCKDIPIKQVSSTTTVTQNTTTDGNNTANTNTAGNNTTGNNTANAVNNTNTTNNTTNNTTTSNAR